MPSTWLGCAGAPFWSAQLPRKLASTHREHTHCGVSVSGSKSSPEAPRLSVGWNSPSACPTSCAAVPPTTSGPQLMLNELPHPAVLLMSAEETTAPPAVVPLKVDTPGIAPS